MDKISTKLASDIKPYLKQAKSLTVAIAMLNEKGLKFLLDNVKLECELSFIIGVDLPTEPKALNTLLKLKAHRNVNVRILTKEFFHPKVYLIKSKDTVTTIVGSANCTNGGLVSNLEMSLITNRPEIFRDVNNWFQNELTPISFAATTAFVKSYSARYKKRVMFKIQDLKEIAPLKTRCNEQLQADIEFRKKLIDKLIKMRNSKKYREFKIGRQHSINQIKNSVDYPKFENINVDEFLSIKALGTIIPIKAKSQIIKNRKKIAVLLRNLCKEDKPVSERIDEALTGRYSVKFLSKAFISKILVVHNPKKYYLHNDAFVNSLKPFGLVFPRGLTFGKKYELILTVLRGILESSKIEDYATLDECLINLDNNY